MPLGQSLNPAIQHWTLHSFMRLSVHARIRSMTNTERQLRAGHGDQVRAPLTSRQPLRTDPPHAGSVSALSRAKFRMRPVLPWDFVGKVTRLPISPHANVCERHKWPVRPECETKGSALLAWWHLPRCMTVKLSQRHAGGKDQLFLQQERRRCSFWSCRWLHTSKHTGQPWEAFFLQLLITKTHLLLTGLLLSC